MIVNGGGSKLIVFRTFASTRSQSVVGLEDEVYRKLRKKLLYTAPIAFGLLLVLDWTGLTDGGFPSSWGQALAQVCANIGWTVFLTAISYLLMIYPLKRQHPDEDDRDSDGERKPE